MRSTASRGPETTGVPRGDRKKVIPRSFVIPVAASLIVFAVPATAQPPRPQPRDAIGAEAPYDPATEVTLRGTVQAVKQMTAALTVTHLLTVVVLRKCCTVDDPRAACLPAGEPQTVGVE
jgi:hypothetical protein